jgi:hypothetical protein
MAKDILSTIEDSRLRLPRRASIATSAVMLNSSIASGTKVANPHATKTIR